VSSAVSPSASPAVTASAATKAGSCQIRPEASVLPAPPPSTRA
jgi:hypothetical protein